MSVSGSDVVGGSGGVSGTRVDPPTAQEVGAALLAALKDGTAGVIVCYTKCWPCQFDDHFEEPTPHPWMDDDDAAHSGVAYPLSAEDAAKHNCGCYCAKVVTA